MELAADAQMTAPASAAEPPTLAYLAEFNRVSAVWCWCEHCRHSATLGLADLIERLGADLPFPAITARSRCGRCGRCGGGQVFARPDWPAAVGEFVGYPR